MIIFHLRTVRLKLKMRKYQQLALVVISLFCIIVFLSTKNENNRLKDVLQVVNFFGRNDLSILKRIENNVTVEERLDFTYPLPSWQAIGKYFHAYASYWNRNELMAGGESLTLVVSEENAVVNFKCSFVYKNNSKSVPGKFHFQRIGNELPNTSGSNNFASFIFYCQQNRDFGQPEAVLFVDITAKNKIPYKQRLRHMKNASNKKLSMKPLVICFNAASDIINATKFIKNKINIFQFFLHHQAVGIEDFVVYNSDEIPLEISRVLQHLKLNVYGLPFNFPFPVINSGSQLRRIIEIDCLLRNTNIAKNILLLEANEFFYPFSKLTDTHYLSNLTQKFETDLSRLEIRAYAVCMDDKRKLLVDNTLYDPEVKPAHRLYLYHLRAFTSNVLNEATISRVTLPLSTALAHRYIDCQHIGPDGLYDWRNSLREDFMTNIKIIRNDLDALIEK